MLQRPSKYETGHKKNKKEEKTGHRNVANSLQIQGKVVLPGDPSHVGGWEHGTRVYIYFYNTWIYLFLFWWGHPNIHKPSAVWWECNQHLPRNPAVVITCLNLFILVVHYFFGLWWFVQKSTPKYPQITHGQSSCFPVKCHLCRWQFSHEKNPNVEAISQLSMLNDIGVKFWEPLPWLSTLWPAPKAT